MNISRIPNRDTQDFFHFDRATIPYKSQAQPRELISQNPWETYRNFKTKTHLPWLYLNLSRLHEPFPFETILAEARKVEHLAVPHRYQDESRGWKSVCLHGVGSDKTEHAEVYGYDEDSAPYGWTDVSEMCPTATMYFKNIFPHGSYQRLRFMYLEPGGFIAPHEDVLNEPPHFTAINIALNQPQDCHFLMGELDINDPRRWGFVPFSQGGDAFWLDLRNHHSVVNLSNETRVHIIIHSAMDPEDSITLQRFNQLLPKAHEEIVEIPPQNEEAKTKDVCKIAVGLFDLNDDWENDVLDHYTLFTERFMSSMMPSRFEYLKSSSIDDLLKWSSEELDADYLLILSSGTIIHKREYFWKVFTDEIQSQQDSKTAIWGHIMDYGGGESPGFHTQAFILDLKKYRSYGSHRFGNWSSYPVSMTEWNRSEDNLHDDYTPFYLKPGTGTKEVQKTRPGWKMIHETLSAGFEIQNIPETMRQTKTHGYPEDNFEILKDYVGTNILKNDLPHPDLEEGQNLFLQEIKGLIESVSKTIWVHNNENWRSLPDHLKDKSFDYVACPAGGGIDYHLFRELKKSSIFDIYHYDISQPNLDFKKQLIEDWGQAESFDTFFSRQKGQLHKDYFITEHRPLWAYQSFDKIKAEPLWADYCEAAHHYIEANLLTDWTTLTNQIPEGKQGLINLSNIYNFLPWLWLYNEKEIDDKFWNLIEDIKSLHPENIIWGKAPDNSYIHYLTCDELIKKFQ